MLLQFKKKKKNMKVDKIILKKHIRTSIVNTSQTLLLLICFNVLPNCFGKTVL